MGACPALIRQRKTRGRIVLDLNEGQIATIAAEAARVAVRETLISVGMDVTDQIKTQQHMQSVREIAEMLDDPEFKADLAHLRRWRKSMDEVSNVGIKTAVGIIVTGFFGMIVFAVKAWLEKP